MAVKERDSVPVTVLVPRTINKWLECGAKEADRSKSKQALRFLREAYERETKEKP